MVGWPRLLVLFDLADKYPAVVLKSFTDHAGYRTDEAFGGTNKGKAPSGNSERSI